MGGVAGPNRRGPSGRWVRCAAPVARRREDEHPSWAPLEVGGDECRAEPRERGPVALAKLASSLRVLERILISCAPTATQALL